MIELVDLKHMLDGVCCTYSLKVLRNWINSSPELGLYPRRGPSFDILPLGRLIGPLTHDVLNSLVESVAGVKVFHPIQVR